MGHLPNVERVTGKKWQIIFVHVCLGYLIWGNPILNQLDFVEALSSIPRNGSAPFSPLYMQIESVYTPILPVLYFLRN